MKLKEILSQFEDKLLNCLLQLSNIVLVLVDSDKKILDCNEGFLKILRLKDKPSKDSLEKFVKTKDKALVLSELTDKTAEFNLLDSEQTEILLYGSVLKLDENWLFLLALNKASYDEMMEKIANLNKEMLELKNELEKKNIQLSEAINTIKRIINTDPLTGVLNRRAFQRIIKREISFSKRHNLPLSIAMIDLDSLKKINDKYGHDIGDYLLTRFAKSIESSIRREDFFARFGGEEFVLLMPNTDIESCLVACERLRQKIERKRFKKVKDKITASFGLTQLLDTDDHRTFIKRAEEAMYEAKRKGKNCCKIN